MQNIFKEEIDRQIKKIDGYLKEKRSVSNEPFTSYIKDFKNFLELYKSLLNIMVKLNLSDSIVSQFTNFYGKTILEYIDKLSNLLDQNNDKSYETYQAINNFLLTIYEFGNSPIQGAKPFPILCSFILSLDSKSLDTIKYNKLVKDLEEKSVEFDRLIPTLRDQASKLTITNYAKLFGEQANLHSSFSIKPFKIGSAEFWLLLAIISASTLIFTVFTINVELSLGNIVDFLKSNFDITKIFQKIFLISLELFFLRFSLKHYNINKNLHVANIHRQNVLNSFRLLYDSIPFEDSTSKSKLMKEVSKSIFYLGTNPYTIENKFAKLNVESLSEILKILRK